MKTSLFRLLLAATLATGTLSYSLSLTPPARAQAVQTIGDGSIDWTRGVLKVTGTGAAPAKGSVAQKRLMARRAAIADGYRQFAELINGVRVDSETIVRDFVTESDTIRTQVSALVKGARMGDTRYMSDGSVEVDMMLDLYGHNSLSSVMQPSITADYAQATPAPRATARPERPEPVSTPMPEPVRTPVPQAVKTPVPPIQIGTPDTPYEPSAPETGNGYTGVIIDCKGLNVAPGMSPSIVDANGKEVYIGDRPIDPDMVVNIGIVGYMRSVGEARSSSRVGKNPLVLRAARAGGKTRVDAVLSNQNAQILKQADTGRSFLSDAKVVFVID